MALRLLQIFFIVLVVMSMAESFVAENLTVMEGETLIIRCSVDDGNISHVEWKNPHGFVIFFTSHKALKDRRYRIVTFSHSEYTISLANVTFKDGGHYTCLQYADVVITKRYKVTVLGFPKLETTEHEDRTAIKCSAEANSPPPKISWLFESGLEVDAPPQYQCDRKIDKCSSVDILLVQSHKKRVTVKCIVHHRALYNSHLMNFISIRKDSTEEQFSAATSTASSTDHSTQSTTDPHSTNDMVKVQAYNLPVFREEDKDNAHGNVVEYLNIFAGDSSPSVERITEPTLTNISTNYSTGEGQAESDQKGSERQSAPLLIFLVTCLIFGLLVVLIFFLIKLRRAHSLWKIENENSDQSLESSKSKSSHEEKLSQERRLQISIINPGFRNTNFTKYIPEEPPHNEIAANAQNEEMPQIQGRHPNPCVLVTSPQIKETEL